jgi:hypothetical protein
MYNSNAIPALNQSFIPQQLLPAIIKLFDDISEISFLGGMICTTIQERAISLFSFLIKDHAKLQVTAMVCRTKLGS